MSSPRQDALTIEGHSANLLLLSWIAGMLDGLSYLRAHVFTANMTGNLVLLGIRLVQHNFADAMRSLLSLGAFALGCAFAAFLLLRREEERGSAMSAGFAAELFFLAGFGVVFQIKPAEGGHTLEGAVIVIAAVALAIQSVTVRRLRVSGVATTFITGTITTAMVGLVRIFRQGQQGAAAQVHHEEEHVGLLVGMLAVYLIAVVFGTALSSRHPLLAGVTPFVILVVVWLRTRGHLAE